MTVIAENGSIPEPSAAALGIFDGVHAGHRQILQKTVGYAAKGLVPAVFTFNTQSVGKKHGKEYEYIYTDIQKRRIFEQLGIKYVCSPEVRDIRNMSGEEFAEKILSGMLNAKSVICGENFRFGKGALCGAEELKKFGKKFGFEVTVCGLVRQNGCEISSEIIRQLIKSGEIGKADRLMGENYFISAPVAEGNRIGRTLDFPTINQQFGERQLIPRKGVYSTVTIADGRTYNSVTNIGVKPTVEKDIKPLAETHILDFSGNLYGQEIEVRFKEFIRDEKKFSSLEELKVQIKKDIEYVRKQTENTMP